MHIRSRKSSAGILVALVCILCLCCALGLVTGPVALSQKIIQLRLVRVLLGLVAGVGLATCGVVFQALLRNPLAEPYVLGVSSGAGLGAVVWAMFFSASVVSLALPAFAGAVATIFLVYGLSRVGGSIAVHGLLLSGVVINIICSSLILFFISTANSRVFHDALWWLLGNLQIFDVRLLLTLSAVTAAAVFIFMFYWRELNAISIGEEEAVHLGIDIEKVKAVLFIATSLLTAVLVSACGIIGFVGLIVPHLARLLVGSNHRIVLPASAILGAIVLVLSDIMARILMPPIEVPIGVMTAFLGGPFFLLVLRRRRKVTSR